MMTSTSRRHRHAITLIALAASLCAPAAASAYPQGPIRGAADFPSGPVRPALVVPSPERGAAVMPRRTGP